MRLILLALLITGCSKPLLQIGGSSCATVRPISWTCGKRSGCANYYCHISYSDGVTRESCTENPAITIMECDQ